MEMRVQVAGTRREAGGRAERWWPGLGAEQGGADSPLAQPQPSPATDRHLQTREELSLSRHREQREGTPGRTRNPSG